MIGRAGLSLYRSRAIRIVLTGGAGFLGSHLCDYLVGQGNSVLAVDNLITSRKENISHLLKNPNFSFLEQDVTKFLDIPGTVDFVLHFASPASPKDYLTFPIETLKVGSLGTHNTLGLAKAKRAKYLMASTSEVYGDPQVHPQTEAYWGNVNPIGERAVYDEAKRFSEALVMAYHRHHKLDTRIVRIFNTYGPRMRLEDGRVVSNFIVQALQGKDLTVYGEGTQTRSFCYVSDLIHGIYRLMLADFHMPVNMGNPNEVSVVELAKEILDISKSKAKITHKPLPNDDPKKRRPDISRAKEILDWTPRVGLQEGLEKTIPWFREEL